MRRLICWLMAAFLLFNTLTLSAVDITTETITGTTDISQNDANIPLNDTVDYFTYYNKFSSKPCPESKIELEASNGSLNFVTDIDGRSGCKLDTGSSCSWDFNVNETGIYGIYISYYALEGTGGDISFSIELDGEVPYSEASSFTLPRTWIDARTDFEKDKHQNDIRPKQIEKRLWKLSPVTDTRGLYDQPYFLYLPEGNHKLTVTVKTESVAISQIVLMNNEKSISYKEYSKSADKTRQSLELVEQQAEHTYEKNSKSLYPVYDRSNASTKPSNPYHTVLNTIGQGNWSQVGMELSWKCNVKSAGWYKISLRVRQNINQGINSYRTLLINGDIPFEEAKNIAFPYDTNWYIKTLGDDSPYLFYLNPGDILTLRIEGGPISKPLRNIQKSVLDMNQLYRDIILITGISPDIYTDYDLDKKIVGLSDRLFKIADSLTESSKSIKEIMLNNGSIASSIDRCVCILRELGDDTYTIPERLSSYKDYVETLGSLLLSLGQQPLEIDYFTYSDLKSKTPSPNVGLIETIKYSTQKFISSFVNDYNSFGTDDEKKAIKVWAALGRDQAQILTNLIESEFTPKTGIPVNLSLLSTGTGSNQTNTVLIQATLAGKGPDIALMLSEGTPVNLAMRGELVDLSQSKYGILEALSDEFNEAAFTPFRYKGGLYALPETMTFDMLFYRTDIFSNLKLKAPETWDEFYAVLKVLQNNQLQVGIPEIDPNNAGVSSGICAFNRFLFQNGGSYYTDDLSSTKFTLPVSIKAFEKWTELYTDYGLDQDFNFYNRFRSGEMAMGIVNISQYSLLAAGAPELNNLWTFTTVPGTIQNDGTINKSESSTVLGCVMFKNAVKKGIDNEAALFLKWWVGTETQTSFGQMLEDALGISARYFTANIKAMKQLGWSPDLHEVIQSQMKSLVNPEQIPGSYVVPRTLTSAFRSVVSGIYNPSRSLTVYNKEINKEIERKTAEFSGER